jgi:antitoxin (DNA-binding transcriptional repressor) of toxin-antitoxin stability system
MKRDRSTQKGTRCSAEAKISELFQQIRKRPEIIILKNGYELARVIPNNQPKAPQIPEIDEETRLGRLALKKGLKPNILVVRPKIFNARKPYLASISK